MIKGLVNMRTMKKNKFIKWSFTFGLLWSAQTTFAQSEELIEGVNNDAVLLAALWATFITLLLIFIILAGVTFSLVNSIQPAKAVELSEEKEPFWHWFWIKFNAAVPKSKEKDILMDHSYDGIRELDNDLPPWWKYGFYLSIVLGVIYLFYYHGGNNSHPVSVSEYMVAVEEAEEQKKAYLARMESLIDESNVSILMDKGDLASGEKIYMDNCRTCHGAAGEGGIGPNLTDKYWLHGGSMVDIFKTIKYGVPEKGMLSWQEKLTPKQIQQTASFITTLVGTNPPNGKEPQGEEYVPETDEVTVMNH